MGNPLLRRLIPAFLVALLASSCGGDVGPSDAATDFTPFGIDLASDESPAIVPCVQGCWSVDCGSVPECGMALIPAGPFMMGCDESAIADCGQDEIPYHQVNLSAYFIDRNEVTVGDYAACVDAGACTPPVDPDPACDWGNPERADFPMTCVDWFQSQAFCNWRDKRLPTEAEWEKAARGGDARIYPWGDQVPSCQVAVVFDDVAGGRGCGTDHPMAVCSKSPAGDSPAGLCDMAGNIWERVSDWYGRDYYAASPSTDPSGPEAGQGRVSRGGTITMINRDTYLRSFNRYYHQPQATDVLLGFRCARDARPADDVD